MARHTKFIWILLRGIRWHKYWYIKRGYVTLDSSKQRQWVRYWITNTVSASHHHDTYYLLEMCTFDVVIHHNVLGHVVNNSYNVYIKWLHSYSDHRGQWVDIPLFSGELYFNIIIIVMLAKKSQWVSIKWCNCSSTNVATPRNLGK